MNYLVAVSGGVDSIVLLDMLRKTDHRLIVAHVDHGIRGAESAADARFVRALAKQYELPFTSIELHLGKHASEEQARDARYRFLFDEATKHHAHIVTAHHRDDMIETVAVNLSRGTGWRGLAVLSRMGIIRPLLSLTKQQLYDYAIARRLEWVEDATNHTDAYLRNRLRRRIHREIGHSAMREVDGLRAKQLQLRHDIDREAAMILEKSHHSRYFLSQIDEIVAVELIGAEIRQHHGIRPPRPQLLRVLHAIKVGKPGTTHDIGQGLTLKLTSRKYEVSVI